jgi:hypothetical protein
MQINGNDQLDLKGSCLSGCQNGDILTFSYNLYSLNSGTNQWNIFIDNSYYYLTGKTLSDLTIKKQLFSDLYTQNIWKIDLILTDLNPILNLTQIATSSLIFFVNQPPSAGTCDINPKSGNTSTLFAISCINWIQHDGSPVLNYVFYGKFHILHFCYLKFV